MDIKKEIPSGIINWVNKIFTTINIISQVDDLWYDWAIYTDFVVNGNQITLNDAPIYSIELDYATWTTNSTTTSQDTFWDIKTEVWDLLWQTSNSTIFSSQKIGKKINAKVREVLRGRITSLLDTNRIYRSGKIQFNEWKTSFRTKAWSRLWAVLNLWDITATCSTNDLYSAWYVQIWSDTINYTWKTTTSILWVSGQTLEHLETEKIVQLYEMPVNFEKPNYINFIIQGNDLRTYEIPYNEAESLQVCYTIIKTWNKTLLKVIWIESDSLIEVWYTKIVYDMVTDSDLCILPDNYGIKVIAPLVAWEYAQQKGLPTSQSILMSGYTRLQWLYQFEANAITITKQSIKPQSYWFRTIQSYWTIWNVRRI